MTTTQDPIAHASRLLREAAEELRQAHTLSSDRNNWIGEPEAKAAYDEHMAAAQALEDWEAAVGAGGVQALSAAPAGFVPVAAFDRLHAHAESLAARLLAAEQAAPKAAPGEPVASAAKDAIMGAAYDFRDAHISGSMNLKRSAHAALEAAVDNALAALAAPQQEAQRPWGYAWRQSPFGWGFCSKQAYEQAAGRGEEVAKLYLAPQPAPALSDDVVRDAAFESVRKKLCALPRFSFLSDGYGAVRRVPDKSGSWIAFDAAHELFDPVAVDAALAAQGGK